MVKCGVMTGFDCNFLPDCILTRDEYDAMMNIKDVFYAGLQRQYSETFWQRAIVCEMHNCTPVIDILPNLQAIRCFGLSELTKQNIADFRSIADLRRHYMSTVDYPATSTYADSDCAACYKRELGECSGGCLLFKLTGD
jgi:hypothetical protein